ncbi:MAG: aminopeptidase [Clostridia bacterium]|nr:aminopeptidase [Clostridia bacterium]
MSDLSRAAAVAVRDCMGARPGETVLIITDEGARTVGTALFDAAKSMGCEAMVIEMIPRTRNGEEPPAPIGELMKHVDVVLAPTSKSISHTAAREAACAAGARVATLPGITEDCMARTLAADYRVVGDIAARVAEVLTRASVVHITNENGTDITMSLEGRTAGPDGGMYHEPGDFGNLPAGEAYIAPVEGSAQGVFVVDGAMAGPQHTGERITIYVVDGYATRIHGGSAAESIEAMIAGLGMPARNIAELGVGTNGCARITGCVLEDEKVLGTIHIAIGDNSHFGGKVAVPSHLDGIVAAPTVTVDGVVIMESGRLLI